MLYVVVPSLSFFSLQPSVNQYGSIHSGNAANGQITSECSATPLLPDFMDSSKCYLHNYYLSVAYYYGGYDETSNEYLRYVNPEGVEMISVSSSSNFTIVNWVVIITGYKLPVIVV
ncbi:hypothetical protein ACFX2I_024801 [Malus domestica]